MPEYTTELLNLLNILALLVGLEAEQNNLLEKILDNELISEEMLADAGALAAAAPPAKKKSHADPTPDLFE